jgi:hypothetical protein
MNATTSRKTPAVVGRQLWTGEIMLPPQILTRLRGLPRALAVYVWLLNMADGRKAFNLVNTELMSRAGVNVAQLNEALDALEAARLITVSHFESVTGERRIDVRGVIE